MGSLLQIDVVTAVLGLLLASLFSIVVFVYRTVKSLPALEKASRAHQELQQQAGMAGTADSVGCPRSVLCRE